MDPACSHAFLSCVNFCGHFPLQRFSLLFFVCAIPFRCRSGLPIFISNASGRAVLCTGSGHRPPAAMDVCNDPTIMMCTVPMMVRKRERQIAKANKKLGDFATGIMNHGPREHDQLCAPSQARCGIVFCGCIVGCPIVSPSLQQLTNDALSGTWNAVE